MSRAHLADEQAQPRRETRGRFAIGDREIWRPSGKITAAVALFLLFGMGFVFLPQQALASSGARAQVSVGISVRFGPPPLPVYVQPMCPGPGYIWAPGYWAWDTQVGYYWVPGTWVRAPFVGALWTPGYWGWSPAVALFVWHPGYWGPRVGFYGGINYGFGYFGVGYVGGYWSGGNFYYNRAVNRVTANIRHTYERRYTARNQTHISYNGGRGGIATRPRSQDAIAQRERRMGPIAGQLNHERTARQTRDMSWSQNQGRPDIAATPRPGAFGDKGVSRATRAGGAYTPPSQAERRGQASPNQNAPSAGRGQGKSQSRGEQGRGTNTQGQRGRGRQ